MNKPIVNILCRTHNRKEYFQKCYQSIKSQTYPNYALHVGSDCDCPYYPLALPLKTAELEYPQPQPSSYAAPWNKHLETLAEHVVPGYVIYLDDDDKFVDENSLQTIVDNLEEDLLLIWRVQITPNFIVPRLEDFGTVIQGGNISGIGIAFHTKWLPVKWSTWSYGDFRIIRELVEDKGINPKFLNKILTSTQAGAHNGQNYDNK